MRLDSLHIGQFRGIENLTLEGFQDVNLLLGGNDTGKTTILEAISLFEKPDDLSSILRASRMRLRYRTAIMRDSFSPFESFLHFFTFPHAPDMHLSLDATVDGLSYPLEICGEMVRIFRSPSPKKHSGTRREQAVEEREISAFEGELRFADSVQKIEVSEDSDFRLISKPGFRAKIEYLAPGQHLSGIVSRYVFEDKFWEQQTVELLHTIDADIEGIKLVLSEYGSGSNQVIEHRQYGEVPLYTYGDGMKKILSLASILPGVRDGILLIDEIETSLQASILLQVFQWLLEACRRYKIQLFVTTHSLEAISTLAQCALNHESELVCYRLEKYQNQRKVRRFSEQMLDSIVNGSGLDVR